MVPRLILVIALANLAFLLLKLTLNVVGVGLLGSVTL